MTTITGKTRIALHAGFGANEKTRPEWTGTIAEFWAANSEEYEPEALDRLMRTLQGLGHATIGGGAAPDYTIRVAQQPGSHQLASMKDRSEVQARFDVAVTDAGKAGAWPVTTTDPHDEIERQEQISASAHALTAVYMDAMLALAERSEAHRRFVSCDQADWPQAIRDVLSDMIGDTFGCLPAAIERARREAAHPEAAE